MGWRVPIFILIKKVLYFTLNLNSLRTPAVPGIFQRVINSTLAYYNEIRWEKGIFKKAALLRANLVSFARILYAHKIIPINKRGLDNNNKAQIPFIVLVS
jgi:hypothetical protein